MLLVGKSPLWSEVRTHEAAWMDLGSIRLSERSQTQKNTYCMILFTCNVQKRLNLYREKIY